MVEIGIDNIYVEFGGHVYQQTVGIPVCTNCTPLVVDLFLYSYEADFVQHLQKIKFKKSKASFNLTYRYRYMDKVISLNNPKFNDYINIIYPEELNIKHTTDAPKWANYVDLCLEFDEDGKLHTQLDDFPSQLVMLK